LPKNHHAEHAMRTRIAKKYHITRKTPKTSKKNVEKELSKETHYYMKSRLIQNQNATQKYKACGDITSYGDRNRTRTQKDMKNIAM
jgi:hypothetical protein